MSRDNGLSMLDANQVIQEVHNETEKAFDVIKANSLVPKRFGKVELEYVESEDMTCKAVSAAKYYSDGAYQMQTMTLHGDVLGSAHKTTVNFYNRNPQYLANTYFTIYEASGPVTIWFDLDNTGTAPSVDNRLIEVDILSSDNEQQLAKKLNDTINLDLAFFAVYQELMVMIVNSTVGVRKNSTDVNTGLVLKNIAGTDKARLDGTFFYINSALDANEYYVWYNIDSSSTDPAIAGKTGLEVAITAGASVEDVNYATALKIAQTTFFITETKEDKLIITNKTIGLTTPIADVNCNFTPITLDVRGSNRELVAHLVMTYDANNDLVSVERL